jgi:hypothetical protein
MAQRSSLSIALAKASPRGLALCAAVAGFSTYFCMYAYRKPFAAATFGGAHFLGTAVTLKTVFVISQIIGYTLSKYIGVKTCSEATRNHCCCLI